MNCSGGHTAVDDPPHFLCRPSFHTVLNFKGAKEVKGGELERAHSLGAFWGQITHDLLAHSGSLLCAGDAIVKHSFDEFSSLRDPGFSSCS